MKKIACVLALVTLASCGSDNNPTGPTVDLTVPNLAGVYERQHPICVTVQWTRQRDGVTGSFSCGVDLTLSQATAYSGRADLTGFLVFSRPCPPQNFDVKGSVYSDGSIRFTSGGPKPPEGQCPAAANVEYSGVATKGNHRTDLSVRGSADIDCPGPGEGPQHMDYILSLEKYD